jgi:lipopolysaccharide/colanic/teichoic acid biosynthesis glycosyltransferase
MKRAFDAALSAVGLVVSVPLWIVIPLAIKLEDGGQIFFSQERVGLHGRIFHALKFRSMIPDAERVSGPVQAQDDDPRITRVGRLLRATALDELPQLWNILVGDMSFVGPRPLRPNEIDRGSDGTPLALAGIAGYAERHRVRPGLTGLAQVYAPRDVPRAEKFRLDLQYVQEAGPLLDIKLILMSFWITAHAQWERRDRFQQRGDSGGAPARIRTTPTHAAGPRSGGASAVQRKGASS